MTIADDATTTASRLTPARAATQATTDERLAAALRAQLSRDQGDDTIRTSLALYEASARACRLRATDLG